MQSKNHLQLDFLHQQLQKPKEITYYLHKKQLQSITSHHISNTNMCNQH